MKYKINMYINCNIWTPQFLKPFSEFLNTLLPNYCTHGKSNTSLPNTDLIQGWLVKNKNRYIHQMNIADTWKNKYSNKENTNGIWRNSKMLQVQTSLKVIQDENRLLLNGGTFFPNKLPLTKTQLIVNQTFLSTSECW